MPRTESATRRPRRGKAPLVATAATILLLTVGVATAAATPTIEGIWPFEGGQIAIEPEPGGSGDLMGIVEQPTKFAACTHPVGQHIWTEMVLQPAGFYEGFHQWYKSNEGEGCVENPVLGHTAWRVLEASDGAKYVLVCLSYPGTTQPTIPPGGKCVGDTLGYKESAMTAPLAGSAVGSFKQVVTLPSNKKCFSGREFAIHIADPKYDHFKSVVVTLRGRKLKVVHRGSVYVAIVNLKGLPPGAFTVKIEAKTFRGDHVSGSRTYHTCAKKPKNANRKKLT